MALMQRKDEVELLQQVQTNLAAMQKNNDLLSSILTQMQEREKPAEEQTLSDDEQHQAAYALNLCTVSVSQIIDYNDIYFLEHEYEAILNNLNLERMPKDEALLSILKQLLDVITYFRIQEGEKKLLEKEYQQKMKNAIWNAVPNFSVLFTPGSSVLSSAVSMPPDPKRIVIDTAVSLASMVGIGYMNYRKEKARIGLAQERKEWELQRSAMEQFNGLRRELFDTAWRLADKYKFPEKYRLTERQITQFNRILMDADDLRRYERLDYISDKFVAYPPFWYYLGNAANAVCQKTAKDRPDICAEYKQKAIEAFQKFRSITKRNLLREDQLKASCTLELFDIWDDATNEDRINLLLEAQEASGNAFDVLQLCALSYMKINDIDNAAELFRMLVNEGYNTNMNAQLLSKIYVMKAISDRSPNSQSRKDYKLLQMRVGANNLFPMPTPDATSYESIGGMFMDLQRQTLQKKYIHALSEFASLYATKYDSLCQRDGNISVAMVALLEDMCSAVKRITPDNSQFVEAIQHSVHNKRFELKAMLDSEGVGAGRSQTVSFQRITKTAFGQLAKSIQESIDSCDSMITISDMEADADRFCIENGLYIDSGKYEQAIETADDHSIALAIFGDKYQEIQDSQARIDNSIDIARKLNQVTPIVCEHTTAEFLLKGTPDFENYINSIAKRLSSNHIRNNRVFAIIQDKRSRAFSKKDLLICIDGIRFLHGDKYCGLLSYLEIHPHIKHDEIAFSKATYQHDAVDMVALRKLITELARTNGELEASDSDNASIIKVINDAMQPSSVKQREIASAHLSSIADENIRSIIRETQRKKPPHPKQIKITGEVLAGAPTVGSQCTLFEQEGIYKIIRIGVDGGLTQSSVKHTTDFTLEEILPE